MIDFQKYSPKSSPGRNSEVSVFPKCPPKVPPGDFPKCPFFRSVHIFRIVYLKLPLGEYSEMSTFSEMYPYLLRGNFYKFRNVS